MHKADLTPENAALLLIDRQLGTMGWTHSHHTDLVKASALKLAKIAKALDRSFGKPWHDVSRLQLLEQQDVVPLFATQVVKLRGPHVAMRDAKVAPVERRFNQRGICNVAAIQ